MCILHWTAVRSLLSVFSSRSGPRTKFVIFGRGRSGTSLLVSLLNGCPETICDSEILKSRQLCPQWYVRARTAQCQQLIYGFKLLSCHLRRCRLTSQCGMIS